VSLFVDSFKEMLEGRVLNIGCFGSTMYDHLYQYSLSGKFYLEGLDIVASIPDKNVRKGDALQMNFKKKFNFIIAGELIEHFTLKQAKTFFARCSDALTKDGTLIMSTPNKKAWSNRLFHKFDTACPKEYSGHQKVYFKRELVEFLRSNNFNTEKAYLLPYDVFSSPNKKAWVYFLRKKIDTVLGLFGLNNLKEQMVVVCTKVATGKNKL
jgi:SAM-dependent methyltransferase